MKKVKNKKRATQKAARTRSTAQSAAEEYAEQNKDIQIAVDAMEQVKLIQEARTKTLLNQLIYSVAEI